MTGLNMGFWWRDLKHGFRVLYKRRGFTLACVLTLALAIGANAGIFSVVNAILLRPLPYKRPDRLVLLWQVDPKQGLNHFPVSIPYFEGWRAQNKVFEQMAAFSGQDFDLTGGRGPERITGNLVSANFFSTLGVQPELGRTFLPQEDEPAHLNVAVISHDLWERRFGGGRLGGQVVTTETTTYTVVGVMPSGFHFIGPSDIWIPLGAKAEGLHLPSNAPPQILASITPLSVVARLKPEVTLNQAQSEIDVITRGLASSFASPWQAQIVDLKTELVGSNTRRILLALLAAVGFVLLIACANVANLQLSRVALIANTRWQPAWPLELHVDGLRTKS